MRKEHKSTCDQAQQSAFVELRDALLRKPILDSQTTPNPFTSSVLPAASRKQVHLCKDMTKPKKIIMSLLVVVALFLTLKEGVQIEIGAIFYALRQFKPYICLAEVTLHSNHKPLTYLLSKSKTHDNLARWMIELQSYSIKVVHIGGNKNTVADALPRVLEDRDQEVNPSSELEDIVEFPVSLHCSAVQECMPIVSMPRYTSVDGFLHQ